jgi:hypothetical protein
MRCRYPIAVRMRKLAAQAISKPTKTGLLSRVAAQCAVACLGHCYDLTE